MHRARYLAIMQFWWYAEAGGGNAGSGANNGRSLRLGLRLGL